MALRQYLAVFRKWAWLIILITAMSAVASYLYSRTMQPSYQAETTLLIGRVLESSNPSPYESQIANSLLQAYAMTVRQPRILEATANAVQWTESWQTLYYKISVTPIGNQLLRVGVTDHDPAQAALIANELTQQLILQGPIASQQKQLEEQRTFVNTQLTDLKLQIESGQKTLKNLTSQASLENDPVRQKDLLARVSSLQANIADWQKNYASLSALLVSSNPSLFVTILAPAEEPKTPMSPNIPLNVLIATWAGLTLAVSATFLFEYLDDTVKDADDVQRVLNLSTLGAIMRIGGIRQPSDHLITVKHPRSPIAEAYRVLRTNLRFSGIGNPSGALLVTSANPGEGKTTTAANLAVTLAQSGKHVILMDTDLRRPSLNKYFDLPNDIGLSSLFLDDAPALEEVMMPTAVEGLSVIPSGPLPPNPAEILDSKQMDTILTNLRSRADLVILDSPPTLAVADASIIGSRCSGAVLVVEAGRTRTDMCRRAHETLAKTNVRVFGVVFNKLSTRRASGYYHYYYYSHDHKSKNSRDNS